MNFEAYTSKRPHLKERPYVGGFPAERDGRLPAVKTAPDGS